MDAWKLVSRTWGSCGFWQYKAVLIVSISSVLVGSACQSAKPGTSVGDLVAGTSQQSATLTYPTASNSIDPFKPFTWNAQATALGYYVQVGTTQGAKDIYEFGELPSTVTSWTVGNLLPGQTYYARLYTHTASAWPYVDVKFQTAPQPATGNSGTLQSTVANLTAAVRNSADFNNNPVSGTPLAAELTSLNRTNAVCTDFALTLIQQLQLNKIYSRLVILTLVGNFWVGHSVVEYYDPFAKRWSVADPTFGAVYFDNANQTGQSAAQLSQLVHSESFSSIYPQFVTSVGDQYMRSYYLDPITLYLNLVPTGSSPKTSVVNDPHQYLIPVTSSSSNSHGAYIAEFGTTSETLDVDNPPGPFSWEPNSVNVIPEDSTVWSRAYLLNDGWSVSQAPPDANVFSFRRVLF